MSLLLFGQGAHASDTVISVPNDQGKIALTFDDGPHPEYTEQILDILAEYEVSATFFVIGENVKRHPDIVAHIIKDGHEIGNHTYTHPHMKDMSEEGLAAELEKTQRLLEQLYGYTPALFRPPEGLCCSAVKQNAKRFGYTLTLWDVDTNDWAHNPKDNIVKGVLTNTKSGDIILCHDFVTRPSPTPDALRTFIPKLKAKGYEFVTVSELLGEKEK